MPTPSRTRRTHPVRAYRPGSVVEITATVDAMTGFGINPRHARLFVGQRGTVQTVGNQGTPEPRYTLVVPAVPEAEQRWWFRHDMVRLVDRSSVPKRVERGARVRVIADVDRLAKQLGIPIRNARSLAGAVVYVERFNDYEGPMQAFVRAKDGTCWWMSGRDLAVIPDEPKAGS